MGLGQLTNGPQLQLKARTAGKDWFDLPAPAEADLPRLYREYEALRLRNHLDPKRFYRKDEGEGKGIKGLPKYFAVRSSPLGPDEHVRSSQSWSRLGRSCRQRRRSANHQAVTSHAQSASARWLKSFYMIRRRRVTQRRSLSRCRRFGGRTAGGSTRKRKRTCDRSGDISVYFHLPLICSLRLVSTSIMGVYGCCSGRSASCPRLASSSWSPTRGAHFAQFADWLSA